MLADRIALLLTCAVNVKQNISYLSQVDPYQRRDCYIKSVSQWLQDPDILKYKIPVVIVENSDFKFPMLSEWIKKNGLKAEIISYSESNISREKGYYECLSIKYALVHSQLLKEREYIVKVTGRYYIPNFPNLLIQSTSNSDTIDCIVQNKEFHSEVVGFRKELGVLLFDEYGINPRYILERALIDRTKHLVKAKLPKLSIEPTKNGGFDTLIDCL